MVEDYRFREPENELEERLSSICGGIQPPSEEHMRLAGEYNDSLCKPLGSMGTLEKIYLRISGIFRGEVPESFRKAVTVYSADNGICEEGISSNPQDTTYKICRNILSGGSGLCRLADFYGVDVELEDLGVLQDVEGHTTWKVRKGTCNPLKERAMSREDAVKGILAGMEKTEELIGRGYDLLGFGEMGVGNTTTSAAVLSALTGNPAEITVGFGSGLTEAAYGNKIRVVNEAVRRHSPFKDVIDVLACVGGLDICAMAGSYLKCAEKGIPFVLDGIISMAALMAAMNLNPLVREYAFSSHSTVERGARIVEDLLELNPPLNLSLRLGEGSGCPIGMSLIEAAVYSIGSMATFSDVAVDKDDYVDIRKKGVDENEKIY